MSDLTDDEKAIQHRAMWEQIAVMTRRPEKTALIYYCRCTPGEYTLKVFADGEDRGPWPDCPHCGRHSAISSAAVD